MIKLRFFTDHNIPDSVGDYLRRRGHSVHRLRHHMADNSPDPVVATAALQADRILVTWDKDFKSQRFMQPRFEALSRMHLVGDGPTFVPALKEHMELVEVKYQQLLRTGSRLIVHIQVGQIRFRA